MTTPTLRQHRPVLVVLLVLTLVLVSFSTAFAREPVFTFVEVRPARNDPPPIPHSDVLDPGVTLGFVQNNLRPQSRQAAAEAEAQGTSGKPGVLQTVTGVANGIYLYPSSNVCNDFNIEDGWQGEVWTSYFAGWGTFAADDGYFQAKNVTFDREQVIGPGNDFGPDAASMKIASNQPYDAGVMSPPIAVEPGDTVMVRVRYLIYNHDIEGRNWDYASMGVIPQMDAEASYVLGYHRGEWAVLEQEITAEGDRVIVMLQGHSPDALNSNTYFDDVEIYVNGTPLSDCKG